MVVCHSNIMVIINIMMYYLLLLVVFFVGTFGLWPGVSTMTLKGASQDQLSAKLQVINTPIHFQNWSLTCVIVIIIIMHTNTYTHTQCHNNIDDRFIMKHIKSIEISSFEQFAPRYLEHVNKALEEKVEK